MYSWGVNASSPCSFSRMPRSFTMPFCSCAKEGGRSDRARPWAASDPRRVTFARKTGAERRAAREPRSRAYRRVSRGRACMKSHPSSRFMTLRSFIIPDAARRARAVSIRKELALSPVTQQVLTRSQARTSPLETLCRVSRVRVTTETPNTRVVRRTSEPRQLARCFTVAPRGGGRELQEARENSDSAFAPSPRKKSSICLETTKPAARTRRERVLFTMKTRLLTGRLSIETSGPGPLSPRRT